MGGRRGSSKPALHARINGMDDPTSGKFDFIIHRYRHIHGTLQGSR
jgi:hypothetical protein